MTTYSFRDIKPKDVVSITNRNIPDFRLSGKVISSEHDINYDYSIIVQGLTKKFYERDGYVVDSLEKHIEKPVPRVPLKFKHVNDWFIGVYNEARDEFVGTDIDGVTYGRPKFSQVEDWQYL